MATARLVSPHQVAHAVRVSDARREARRTAAHLRRLAAQVIRTRPDKDGRHLATILRNGAWAVEDVYGLHTKEGG